MTVTINGTTGVAGVDGTASTPAIQGNDTNTGIFFPAADTIAFAEGGTESMRLDSNGNVGIGTSSPTDTGSYGRVLDINSSTGAGIALRSNGSSTNVALFGQLGGTAYLENRGAGSIQFYNNGSERMRIDSSGNLLVGMTNNLATTRGSWFASGSGNILVGNQPAATAAVAFNCTNNGNNVGQIQINTSSTAYITSSDYRLKKDIQPMTGALAKVAALKPVTYKWKVDGEDGEGFIAHELAEVCPQAVSGEKDAVDAEGNPQYQGIDTSFLVATLTAAIQEQQAIITDLKSRIEALEQA